MDNKEKQMSEFKQLLESIPNSYLDFVNAGLREAQKNDKFITKVATFIKNNPQATTSDIIKYETEEIFGIKPLS